jgi:hypothetical protein
VIPIYDIDHTGIALAEAVYAHADEIVRRGQTRNFHQSIGILAGLRAASVLCEPVSAKLW